MATTFGVTVCPYVEGVGLWELVQHLSVFDCVRASGQLEGRNQDAVRGGMDGESVRDACRLACRSGACRCGRSDDHGDADQREWLPEHARAKE